MGKMKELYMEKREEMLDSLSWDPTGTWDTCDKLTSLAERGYWIQVSPLARINPEEWIAAIYIKGKNAWVTEECRIGFNTPKEAFEWAEEQIIQIDYAKNRDNNK